MSTNLNFEWQKWWSQNFTLESKLNNSFIWFKSVFPDNGNLSFIEPLAHRYITRTKTVNKREESEVYSTHSQSNYSNEAAASLA